MGNIYNAIQNLYNMDKTTWQEVLAELYNLVSNVENKFDLFENKFGSLLGKEVTIELKKMYDDGSLAALINDKLFKDINKKVDAFKTELSEQLDNIANKGTTVEVIERVTKEEIDRQIADGTIANLTSEKINKDVSELKEEVSDITNNKLKNISVDYIKIFQSETYDYNSTNLKSIAKFWYCNNHTFDEDIILESLTLTVISESIGEKIINFAIVDKNMNVVENTTLNFNVTQTGESKVTIPLGERVLTAGSYICLQKVGDCSNLYGTNNNHTIRSVNINENSATFDQTITKNCLVYSIAYKKGSSFNEYLHGLSAEIGNRLYSKKIIAIGDSMVEGHSISKDEGWLAMIANRNNMTYVNYGINGTFMTNKLFNSKKGVVERYMDMDDDADYVVVFAATNDANAGVTIGTNDSTNPAELKGALNIICTGLLSKYPTAKIMFITPYLRKESYRSYAQAIHDICEDKYSIKVYDNIKHGGICWTNDAQVQALTLKDTYHLNLAGMEYASYKYEEELKRL